MAENDKNRRERLAIKAVNPVSGGECEVYISYDRMQTVGKRSLGHAKECGYIVPAILQGPTAIFEGLTREEDEDRRGVGWRCYCGLPKESYRADGTAGRPYPGQVYLVFVNEEGVAYNWRWEKADPADPNLPEGHERRFKRRVL